MLTGSLKSDVLLFLVVVRYYARYLDADIEDELCSPQKAAGMPVDLYVTLCARPTHPWDRW